MTGRAAGTPLVEHAVPLTGGGMQILPGDPELGDDAAELPGGRVYVRTVFILEDWHEVDQ